MINYMGKKLEIVYKNIKDVKPYERNPRKNDEAVKYVAESIYQFGFKVPLVIDKNNIVVCGHTRLKAAKDLGITEVPCILADDLTEEEIKAFRLADNKVSEQAEWDFELLDLEMDEIETIDMEEFGFDFYNPEQEHEINVEKNKERVLGIHNIDIACYQGVGAYDIPQIEPVYELPPIKEWQGFNYVLSDENPEGKAVHFFIDDYQFERLWNDPDKYIEKLRQYVCITAPDFSPYEDMPMATQIFNHYRKHWVAKYLQDNGVTVIPTIRASADPRSLEWYLDGEPHEGIVCISNMWTSKKDIRDYFLNYEYKNMIETLNPNKIFIYGKPMEELKDNIEYIQSFASKRFDKE